LSLLITEPTFKTGKHFCLKTFWPKAEDFLETMEGTWNSTPVITNRFKHLPAKLVATVKALST
jgi:hypothetical protein